MPRRSRQLRCLTAQHSRHQTRYVDAARCAAGGSYVC
jgi:hypothetical protein